MQGVSQHLPSIARLNIDTGAFVYVFMRVLNLLLI